VLGERFGVGVPKPLQKARRALDVGEEKGDGSGWKGHVVTVKP
jgi:hypothetical protein